MKITLIVLFIGLTSLSLIGCNKKTPAENHPVTSLKQAQPQYAAKLIEEYSGNKVISLPGAIAWKPDGEATLKYHAATGVAPMEIILKRPMPNGLIEALAVYRQVEVELPLDLDDSDCNDNDSLKTDCIIEIGLHSFNNDGTPEIIVAIGDTLTSLRVNVIKYFPPATDGAADRPENWQLVGKFDGQSDVRISDNTVELPYGSQGLSDEYTWVKNKFLKSN